MLRRAADHRPTPRSLMATAGAMRRDDAGPWQPEAPHRSRAAARAVEAEPGRRGRGAGGTRTRSDDDALGIRDGEAGGDERRKALRPRRRRGRPPHRPAEATTRLTWRALR